MRCNSRRGAGGEIQDWSRDETRGAVKRRGKGRIGYEGKRGVKRGKKGKIGGDLGDERRDGVGTQTEDAKREEIRDAMRR